MENQDSHGRAKLVASIVLLVVIGASLIGAVYLRTNSTPASKSASTTTSQSTKTQSPTYYSVVSPLGVQLQVKLSSTATPQGSPLTAQVSLVNTLATNVSLAADYSANPNIANWDNYDTLCGLSSVDDTFGFALFQGNYAAGNFSQAGTPLSAHSTRGNDLPEQILQPGVRPERAVRSREPCCHPLDQLLIQQRLQGADRQDAGECHDRNLHHFSLQGERHDVRERGHYNVQRDGARVGVRLRGCERPDWLLDAACQRHLRGDRQRLEQHDHCKPKFGLSELFPPVLSRALTR